MNRHGWDFMLIGSFMPSDLGPDQRRRMRDWYATQIVRYGSDDVWLVSQDRRDGNNGPHQMEHNGMGAYPAWAYHYGYALHRMGFQEDVERTLEVIKGITRYGAYSQGWLRDGRRCRSNWVNASGASLAAFIPNFIFNARPGYGEFRPQPRFIHFDPTARLEGMRVRGRTYTVTRAGAEAWP
jgi:hypothetical protein